MSQKVFQVVPRFVRVCPKLVQVVPRSVQVCPRLFQVVPEFFRVWQKLICICPKLNQVVPRFVRVSPRLIHMVSGENMILATICTTIPRILPNGAAVCSKRVWWSSMYSLCTIFFAAEEISGSWKGTRSKNWIHCIKVLAQCAMFDLVFQLVPSTGSSFSPSAKDHTSTTRLRRSVLSSWGMRFNKNFVITVAT